MVVIGAWLSTKIQSPWLAALLGVILLIIGINGLISDNMPALAAVLICVVGVINVLRLLPQHEPVESDAATADR